MEEFFSHTLLARILEVEPQFERDLTAPGFLRFIIASRKDQLSYILRVDIGIRIIEMCVVEDVRDLGCERRAHPLSHRKGLSEAEVMYVQAWT